MEGDEPWHQFRIELAAGVTSVLTDSQRECHRSLEGEVHFLMKRGKFRRTRRGWVNAVRNQLNHGPLHTSLSLRFILKDQLKKMTLFKIYTTTKPTENKELDSVSCFACELLVLHHQSCS